MERRAVVGVISSVLLITTVVTAANYTPPYQPVRNPAFLTLPVGAVKPAGWLRDWAWAARNGMTGHLDEYHPVWRDAWKGIPVDAAIGPETTDPRNGWPLEQCADWFAGLVPLGYQLEDTFLISKATARLDGIIDNLPQTPRYQWDVLADFADDLIR